MLLYLRYKMNTLIIIAFEIPNEHFNIYSNSGAGYLISCFLQF